MSCDSQDSNTSSGSRCHLWVYQDRDSLWDHNEQHNNGPPPVRKHKPLGLSHSFPRGLATTRWLQQQQPSDHHSNKPQSSNNEAIAGQKKRRRKWVLKSNQRSWPSSSSKWCVCCLSLFPGVLDKQTSLNKLESFYYMSCYYMFWDKSCTPFQESS